MVVGARLPGMVASLQALLSSFLCLFSCGAGSGGGGGEGELVDWEAGFEHSALCDFQCFLWHSWLQ